MHFVTDALYVSGHKIKIQFENGDVKLVNLEHHLQGPIFQPLKNVDYFKSFAVNHDMDTITWENDADFSPDFLYEIGEAISEQ